jgi:hypothetical protein
MDDLLRLARSHLARFSDPQFEAQCNEFNEVVVSALADFEAVRDLQRAWFNFPNATSALKTQCSKINQRWAIGTPVSELAAEITIDAERHTVSISAPQELQRHAGEHKCQDDPVLLALLKFRVAAQDLYVQWQETDGTHAIDITAVYPFQESFEDVLTKITIWTETAFRIVDGYCESCCLPDHHQCSLTAGCPCCDMRNSPDLNPKDTLTMRPRSATRKKRQQRSSAT